jgi:hypothetical protein
MDGLGYPALVPCLGPSAGVYYPIEPGANGCRIQTDEKFFIG